MNLSDLTLVTGSASKLAEAQRILRVPLRSVALDLPEPQAVEVAAVVEAKARAAWEALGGVPVMVDDTGLSFDAWNGLPGALVKWFLATAGPEGVCRMLDPFATRAAAAVTVIAVYDGTLHTFEGRVRGTVPRTPRGDGGFGWDPLFIPDGSARTFAEMAPEEKDGFSMRRIALESLAAALSPTEERTGCDDS